jgi:quercetin dioxygenase-like cupin family protein
MEEKYNNATPQRPSGHRALDGQLVSVDLPKYITEIKNEAAYHENGKNAITVFKSEHATTTLVALKNGEKIQSGTEEQHLLMSLYLIEGALSFSVNGREEYVSEGQLISYHYERSFQASAQADCVCLLTVIK